ncbi:PcfJ domain-containing protein [Anaerovibrio lipolyticus]|nr:PcfJ domain-containing protein [Anaerovibrio lipolyticus]
MESYGLPNIKSVRRIVQRDMFSVAMLGEIGKIVSDPNHILAIYRYVDKVVTRVLPQWSFYSVSAAELIRRIQVTTEGRSGAEIRRFLKYIGTDNLAELRDIESMYLMVPKEVQEESKKVKLKDLHNWLVEQRALMRERGFELKVPQHIVRRLTMQLDSVKFYLPHHSKELVTGSNAFHNCVKTYADRVLGGECQIAYMTDDKGKLVACLEVKKNRLVQAKLKFNKPVKQDRVVNASIVEWCEKAKLEICTCDIDPTLIKVDLVLEQKGA